MTRVMTRPVRWGLPLVLAVELVAVVGNLRPLTLVFGGVVVAMVLYLLHGELYDRPADGSVQEPDHDPEDALAQWLARTEILIRWADRSRGHWDQHLRPLLAREFEMVTGLRGRRDRAELDATGRMAFGELWPWVDPSAASYPDRDQPAPGRDVLDAILRRLVRL